MFASKDLFDGGEEVDVDASGNAEYQNARPMTAASVNPAPSTASIHYSSQTFERTPSMSTTSSNNNSSMTLAGSLTAGQTGTLDDLPANTPTPAMRKAKMEEMRKAHLDKRKQKALAQPTVLRQNQDQIKSGSSLGGGIPGVAAQPVLAPSLQKALSSPSNNNNAGAASAPKMAQNGEYINTRKEGERDSDEEDGSAAVDTADSNMNSLLAEKRAERDRKNISQAERGMMEQGIAPVFDPVKPMMPGVKLDFSDMRSFLVSPVPKGMLLQCYILRNKKGLKNKIYPVYEAYISGEERFLLAAKKRTKNKTSNYMISMDKNNVGGKESASYLGKVRSNFVGTEFIGYDKGINPRDLDAESANISLMSVRQELCAVFYESNILGSKGPRKMTAVIPSIKKDGAKNPWKPLKETESVLNRYKAAPSHPDFMSLVNKTPKWNEQVGAYVLNFNGRVTQASVKNFQLIHVDDPENVILQFGRIGKDR